MSFRICCYTAAPTTSQYRMIGRLWLHDKNASLPGFGVAVVLSGVSFCIAVVGRHAFWAFRDFWLQYLEGQLGKYCYVVHFIEGLRR